MLTLLVRALFALFSLLPLRAAHAVGSAIGTLFWLIPNRRRRTAETNLKLCFPEKTEAERAALVREGLREYAKGFAELGVLWTCDADRLRRVVPEVVGEDAVQKAIAAGKGVIFAGPHTGAWELAGLYVSMLAPMSTMFRPPPMAQLGDAMRRARERFGARLVPADASGVRALLKALSRGESIGILPDQVPADMSGAVFAPFFGQPAATMVLLSRLAAKSGAAVFFGIAVRLPRGRGFRLHLLPAPPEVASDDNIVAATAVNAMVEQGVRLAPAQYQWIYKRFRVRPAGEAPVY